MTTEENKAFIRHYLDQLHRDKTPALLREYINEEPLMQHIAFYEQVFPGYWLEEKDLVAEGDKVACYVLLHATHKGELMGMPPTGKTIAVEGMLIYQIADGMIVNHWMVLDGVGMLQQLGALTTPA